MIGVSIWDDYAFNVSYSYCAITKSIDENTCVTKYWVANILVLSKDVHRDDHEDAYNAQLFNVGVPHGRRMCGEATSAYSAQVGDAHRRINVPLLWYRKYF